jgi:hypothetical protein
VKRNTVFVHLIKYVCLPDLTIYLFNKMGCLPDLQFEGWHADGRLRVVVVPAHHLEAHVVHCNAPQIVHDLKIFFLNFFYSIAF